MGSGPSILQMPACRTAPQWVTSEWTRGILLNGYILLYVNYITVDLMFKMKNAALQ